LLFIIYPAPEQKKIMGKLPEKILIIIFNGNSLTKKKFK
jgi:hypothetical protein